MDADSDGEGEVGDLGELGLNDEEGMAKFLEDVIGGEIDDSMIEEFRTSDIFDDFLKELSRVNNNGGSANVSRRPSFENEREGKQNEVFDILNSKAEAAAASRPQTEKCDPSLSSGTSSKKRRKLPKKYSSNVGRREGSDSDSSSNGEYQVPVSSRKKKKETGKDMKIRDKLKICVKPSNSGKKSKSQTPYKSEKPSKKTSTPSTSSAAIIATTSKTPMKKAENRQQMQTHFDCNKADTRVESERHGRLSSSSSQPRPVLQTQIKKCRIALIDLIHLAETFSNGLRSCAQFQYTPELEQEILTCEEEIKSQTRKFTQPLRLPPKDSKPSKKLIDLENVRAVANACNKERSQRMESPTKKDSSSSSKTLMDAGLTRQEDSSEHQLESQTSNITITDKLKKKALKMPDERESKPLKETGELKKKPSKETEELKKMPSKETSDLKKTPSKEADGLKQTHSKETGDFKKTPSKETEEAEGVRKSEDRVTTPEMSTEPLASKESQVCERSSSRQSSPVRESVAVNEEVDVDANKTKTSIDDLPIEVFDNETTTSFSGVNISELESLDLVAETVVPLSPKEIGAKDLPILDNLELNASEASPKITQPQSEVDQEYVQGNAGKEDCIATLDVDDDIANAAKKDNEDETNAKDTVAEQPVEEDVDDNEDYEPHLPSDEFPIIETEDAVIVSHETSPDKVDEQHKSPSPERIVSVKKKKFIESSSDDGDNVRKDHDDSHTNLGRKKSSDEENHRSSGKKVSFERKKDTVDYRSKKFDEFQNERQRKLSEKKKEKEKSKENDALEEIFKEKTLTGSFRIPKKTTGYGKPEPRNVSTPLAVTEAPKENLQFERSRKGKEKDKESYREYNNDLYMGPKYSKNKGVCAGASGFNRNRDDGRMPVLLPFEEVKRDPDPPDEPEPEPAFADDPAGGDDFDDDNNNDSNNVIKEESVAQKNTKVPETTINEILQDIKEEFGEYDCGDYNPEVPLTELVCTDLVVHTITHMETVTPIVLPDTDEIKDVALLTLMKIAWWFCKHNNDNFMNGDAYASDSNSSNGSGCSSESSYLGNLDFSDDSDNPDFSKLDRSIEWRIVDEHCGASLLKAQYRSGPGDTFSSIFQSRSKFTYTKDNKHFQVRCNLCNQLVVGAVALADHVRSPLHTTKMSRLEESAVSDPTVGESKEVVKSKDSPTAEKDKNPERPSKSNQNGESSKQSVSVEKTRKSDGDKKDGQKRDSKDKRKDDEKKNREKEKKSKRKRSKERGSSAEKSRDTDEGGEVGVTSTGLPIKIPASAMPERKRSRSRDRRSRSPHYKRNRSRSPRHKRSKSPRKKSRSPRRRRKSRSPITRVERERVPRGEIIVRDIKREHERRRSTSAERVEKFLARTKMRSRSPSNSNGRVRKRSRRSRSKSPAVAAAAMPKRDNREFHEKLALTADGKWTEEMENRWKLMEVEEAMFVEQYGERKKLLLETPEKHENYGDEWTLFWEKRFQEIEMQGMDPEKHDYVPEWKEFWSRRLKELLAKEFEDKIKDIKKQHGMDFETLQKLRVKQDSVLTPPAPVLTPHQVPPPQIILASQPVPSPHMVVTPQPVPIPHVLPPQMVPPPQAVVSPFPGPSPKASSIRLGGGGSISARSTTSDDITARSMSISDGGSGHDENHKATPSKPVVPVTAGDIMSTWEKLRTGGGVKQEPTYSGAGVSTKSSLPTAAKTDTESNAESGSIASYESETCNIHILLRLMCSCEDQLSFLASKVQEYFYKSEEMELKKRNSAMKLMDDEEFVALLVQVRDRFMAMIRAGILPSDVLRNLNHIVYALDSMNESPQFQKHRAKLASVAAVTNVEPEVKVNTSVIDNSVKNPPGSSVNVAKVSSTTANKSSNINEEIARQLAAYLIIEGRTDMAGNELREFIRLMVLSPGSQNKAAASNTPPINATRRSEPRRRSPMGLRRDEVDNDPWGVTATRNMTKTHNVASATTGSGRFPSLPDAHMPSTDEDEPRGRGMGRGRGGGGNISSSENIGTRSPYRGRGGYMGMHQGSPPYYDQDGQNPPSNNSVQNILNALDASSSVVTSMLGNTLYRQKQNLHELQKHREITMGQLITKEKEVVNERISSKESSSRVEPIVGTSNSNEPKEPLVVRPQLPPGIMNMIMKEKQKQDVPEAGEIMSDDGSPYYRRRKREPQKKKKKKKRQRAREYRHTSSDSESDSDSRRKPHRKRKRRKRSRSRKDENRRRSPSPIRSEKSNGSSIQLIRKVPRRDDSDVEVLAELPPTSTPSNSVPGRSLLRDRNANDTIPNHAYNWNAAEVTSPVRSPSPALPIAGLVPARSSSRLSKVSGISHVLPSPPASLGKRNYNWESLSDASSGIQQKKTSHSNSTQKGKKIEWMTVESKKAFTSGNKKNEETRKSEKPLMSGNSSRDKANAISKPTNEKGKISFTLTKRPEVSKVTSVSKTFWTTNDDAQSLCSISTNESTDLKDSNKPVTQASSAQPIRKYRNSCEDKNFVKEPGEISDSNSSVSSDE